MNIICLLRVIPVRLSFSRYIVKPVIASALMGICAYGVYRLCMPLGSKLSLIVSIMSGAIIYLLSVFALKVPDEGLLMSVPGLSKLVPILKKLKLITEEK